jgi:hypothetical protein
MKKCLSRDETRVCEEIRSAAAGAAVASNIFSTFLLCSLSLCVSLSELEFNRKKFSVVSENLFL